MLTLFSWNTAHRTGKLPQQVAAILKRQPDIVALQEVTVSTHPRLSCGLAKGGLDHFACSLESEPDKESPNGPRKYGVAIASRFPILKDPNLGLPVPWPEKTLSCIVECEFGSLEVHSVYVPPGSSNGWIKIETLEGIYQGLAKPNPARPRILCGDFNSPKEEYSDGTVVAWGQRRTETGELINQRTTWGQPGDRWPEGERSILLGLAEFDLPDVFRKLHGYRRNEFSWVLRRNKKEFRRRFDHVFASRSLAPQRCRYIHQFRETGLSDHSAVEVEFDPELL
jgi:exonuclease III